MAIELDTTLWPMAMTTIAGELSLEEIETYFDQFVRQVLGRGESFVSVVDATQMDGTPGAPVRESTARWLADNHTIGGELGIGYVIALRSALARGAITALHWVRPPPTPTKLVANRAQAVRWAVSRMEERQMVVSPAIYGYLEDLEEVEHSPHGQAR